MRYQERNNADPNTQLLAKNFPGDITIDQIRGYFSQFGTLEDVQITFTQGGPGELQYIESDHIQHADKYNTSLPFYCTHVLLRSACWI